MKHLFVPYELALKLKEFEFEFVNYWAFGKYIYGYPELGIQVNGIYYEDQKESVHYILAPLYHQVIDWFIEKHNIHLAVDFEYLTNKYDVMFQEKTKGRWERYTRYYSSETYNEALNKAIEEALKLI